VGKNKEKIKGIEKYPGTKLGPTVVFYEAKVAEP
jgi:hypothetical protein